MLMRVERYFYYNGEEYVLLRQVDSMTDESNNDEGDERLYVMRVKVSLDEEGEEIEDFEPIDSELMEALIKTVQITFHHDFGEEDSNPV